MEKLKAALFFYRTFKNIWLDAKRYRYLRSRSGSNPLDLDAAVDLAMAKEEMI